MTRKRLIHRRLLGMIPAGGRATRLAPLPCSKEILPVGYEATGPDNTPRPKVVAQYLLEKMHHAGVDDAYIILRSGKWDIAEYFGNGSRLGMHLGYLLVDEPFGPPFTLDQAYPFAKDRTVVFGYPDILFRPDDAFTVALERLESSGADVVVGLFPSLPDTFFDTCEVDANGRVLSITVKEANPRRKAGQKVWSFAVWTQAFTEFLHTEIIRLRVLAHSGSAGSHPEWPVGVTIDAAIHAGLHVDSVYFDNGLYLDIGAPDRLTKALDFPGVWDGKAQ